MKALAVVAAVVGASARLAHADPSDEQLAAIQKAMTELDSAAHACWATAAAIRFDIEGDLEARIDIDAGNRGAKIEIVSDTTKSPVLAACMSKLLAGYAWAPPLRGQTIQLPFRFRAPDGQNVVDRSYVPVHGQAGISIAVLLDSDNANSEAASMLEVALAPKATTGRRVADRAELWFFLADTIVDGKPIARGAMMFVPAGAVRTIAAGAAEARAVLVVAPGGREGSARAGALPMREAFGGAQGKGAPIVLAPDRAATYTHAPATVHIFAEPSTIHSDALSASILELPAGAHVPEHMHDKQSELLYLLDGSGVVTVGGVALPLAATSVVQIPAGVKHSLAVATAIRALQIYTPAGPEQRFKK